MIKVKSVDEFEMILHENRLCIRDSTNAYKCIYLVVELLVFDLLHLEYATMDADQCQTDN